MTLQIRAYDQAGGFVSELVDVDVCEISADLGGSGTGRVVMSKPAVRRQKASLRPDGIGAYVTVDARSLPIGTGVPEVYLGRLAAGQTQTAGASGTLPLEGPRAWFAEAGVGYGRLVSGTPYQLLLDVVSNHPWDLRLVMGSQRYRGAGKAPYELQGQSVADLIAELEMQRGVWIRTRASSLGAIASLDVLDPGSPDIADITLYEGKNSEWDWTQALQPGMSELTIVAQSFMAAGGVVAGSIRAPQQAVLGQRHGHKTAFRLATAAAVSQGGGPVLAMPELSTRSQLDAVLIAEAQRRLPMMTHCPVQITDTSLWSSIRPGVLVACRCTDDPFGDFETAVALIEQCTWSVTPPYSLSCSVTLWDAEVLGA